MDDPANGYAWSVQTRFGPLTIEYDERVLTPRAWTARQSRWAADLMAAAPPGPVLELCAGVGHIGLLAVAGCDRELVCVDLNEAACDFARKNAASAGMADRVEVRHGDLVESVRPDERFAVAILDPPYLLSAEVARYPEDPVLAIDGGVDGLDLVWRCLDVTRDHLLPGGSAVLQLRSALQAIAVRDRLAATDGLRLVEYRSHGRGVLALIQPG